MTKNILYKINTSPGFPSTYIIMHIANFSSVSQIYYSAEADLLCIPSSSLMLSGCQSGYWLYSLDVSASKNDQLLNTNYNVISSNHILCNVALFQPSRGKVQVLRIRKHRLRKVS